MDELCRKLIRNTAEFPRIVTLTVWTGEFFNYAGFCPEEANDDS